MKKHKYRADSDRFTAELGESPNSLVASRRRIGLNINLVMLAWPRVFIWYEQKQYWQVQGQVTVLYGASAANSIAGRARALPRGPVQYPVRFPYCNHRKWTVPPLTQMLRHSRCMCCTALLTGADLSAPQGLTQKASSFYSHGKCRTPSSSILQIPGGPLHVLCEYNGGEGRSCSGIVMENYL